MLELALRGEESSCVRIETGSGVDSLIRYPDGRRELIQVCTDMDAPDARDHEQRGLVDALAEQKSARAHLILL